MLTPGNYKVTSSRLLVAEDGTAQLELTMYAYPKPYTALFELAPVQSEEDQRRQYVRTMCIDYLRVKFNWDEVQGFIEYIDTTPEQWLEYIATNKATGEFELQRGDLMMDVIKFLDRES